MIKALLTAVLLFAMAGANSEVLVMNVTDGQTIRANGGVFSFWVSADESYRVVLNGNNIMLSLVSVDEGEYPHTMQYTVNNLSRGSHQLVVETMQDGSFVATQEINFTVQRVSRLL